MVQCFWLDMIELQRGNGRRSILCSFDDVGSLSRRALQVKNFNFGGWVSFQSFFHSQLGPTLGETTNWKMGLKWATSCKVGVPAGNIDV